VAPPEDVLIEAWRERVGKFVTEEAEVVGIERSPDTGTHLSQDFAEHIHKLALVSHLQNRQLSRSSSVLCIAAIAYTLCKSSQR